MEQYAPKFRKESGVKRVSDLKYIGEGELQTFGMTAMTDKKRVMAMIRGEELAKANFALQSRAQARTIISNFLADSREVEEVLDIIGEDRITGW